MIGPSPICFRCRHYAGQDRVCAAFPAGIPDAIWKSLDDHQAPVAGDGGLRFEPLPDADPAAIEAELKFRDAMRERMGSA